MPLILCFFLLQFLRPSSHATKLPPGPTGLPILGSLLEIGKLPHRSLARLAKIHGPLITLRLGSITTVVASSPQTAKLILQTHGQNFLDRPAPEALDSPQGTIGWIPADHVWRSRRRVCINHLFTSQSLDSLQHLRYKKVEQLLQHIRKHCVSGTPVDIGLLTSAINLNVLSNAIFSVDLVDPGFESAQDFRDLVWGIMEGAGKFNISDYFPMFRRFDLLGVKRDTFSSYKRLYEIVGDIIKSRIKCRASNPMSRNDDFLDVILDQCQEDGSVFNSDNIQELFYAGSDTSTITTEWAMTELLRNPRLMQKVRQELSEVIGVGQMVRESDMDRLPYFQAVVKETLRLHPAGPLLLPFKAKNDVELCGFTIPSNSHVLVNMWAIARDPGRRICPGIPLAIRMVQLVLASIIHSFNWKLPEGTTPLTIDMQEQCGATLKKAIPLSAIPFIEEN
ncbi:Geraniol 8-hydroxylase [Vitis vinifera]|uniref:Geraniol 8-hydroxylase n=1 Tax=Vitis vinifera TaxID=29760 RepID=A0A438GQA7_VITVI|nr:Geraniol 8-hydroxylase [Vitis vinifera]